MNIHHYSRNFIKIILIHILMIKSSSKRKTNIANISNIFCSKRRKYNVIRDAEKEKNVVARRTTKIKISFTRYESNNKPRVEYSFCIATLKQ